MENTTRARARRRTGAAELRATATVIPLIFLGVAAFLLNVVLSRLIILQRPEIAALKANVAQLQDDLATLKATVAKLCAELGAPGP